MFFWLYFFAFRKRDDAKVPLLGNSKTPSSPEEKLAQAILRRPIPRNDQVFLTFKSGTSIIKRYVIRYLADKLMLYKVIPEQIPLITEKYEYAYQIASHPMNTFSTLLSVLLHQIYTDLDDTDYSVHFQSFELQMTVDFSGENKVTVDSLKLCIEKVYTKFEKIGVNDRDIYLFSQ
eukprot:NODE_855_length_3523_cov_0.310164.p2 type:complete len:176 gc:universal NODE_855_length_3523_cov_0.310164:2871-2344(-)